METKTENHEIILNRIADKIVNKGLEFPAGIFLEIYKPLTFISGQCLLFTAPFLIPFFGTDRINNYYDLLQDRKNVDRLIEIINTKAESKRNL